MTDQTPLQNKYKNIRMFPEVELMKRQAFNESEIEITKKLTTGGSREQVKARKARIQYMMNENNMIKNELELRERYFHLQQRYDNKKKEAGHLEIYINKLQDKLTIASLERDLAEARAEKLKQTTIEQAADIAFLEIRLKRVALHK